MLGDITPKTRSESNMGAGQKSQEESGRRYHLANSEQIKQQNAEWRKNNSAKTKAQHKRRSEISKKGAACAILKQHEEDLKAEPGKLTLDFMKRILNLDCE